MDKSANGKGTHKDIQTTTEMAPASGAEQTPAPGNGLPLFWDSLPPTVTELLSRPLDPGLVSQRKGRAGRSYSYIEGHTAIDQANRVFGYGGWGYELVGEVALREIENLDKKTGEVQCVRAYCATVKVTVPGAMPKTDVGFHAVVEDTAEGHDTAYKGAVTDGLKRALRSFGDQFGNGLYGDGNADSPAPSTGQAPASGAGQALAPSLRQTILELGATQGFDEKQVHDAVKRKMGRDMDQLTAEELSALLEAAVSKMQQASEESGESA